MNSNCKLLLILSSIYFASIFDNECYSQVEYSIGIYPSGSIYLESDLVPNPKKEIVTFITPAFQLKVNYFTAIFKYSYSFGRSNYREVPIRNSISLGLRREIPFEDKKWNEKLKVYVEVDHSFRNYLFKPDGELELSKKLNHYSILPTFGFDAHLSKRFEFEFALAYRFNKGSFNHFDKYVGLLFNINPN